MELHVFGYDGSSELKPSNLNTASPATCFLRTKAVKTLWSSWCNTVIAHQDCTGIWTVAYRGIGLTSAQAEHMINSEDIKNAIGGNGNALYFFGSAMHDGLRGYVLCKLESNSSEVVLFAIDLEIEAGVSELQFYTVKGHITIAGIQMGSGGDVLVSIASHVTGEKQVVQFENIAELRKYLVFGPTNPTSGQMLSPCEPLQWYTNSTTSTILGEGGQVHTATHDPRYSKCLGRTYEGTASFEPVPYLSETFITRIASGGFMTAAVSSEGELFLWGQACPGTDGELSVLMDKVASGNNQRRASVTGISTEDEQDVLVKCLTVRIDGNDAQVYDVAIGHGHILVAAEAQEFSGPIKRTVFAAGDNSRGQLGLVSKNEFFDSFEEVLTLRGKKIVHMAAAGWTTCVATQSEEPW